MLIVDTHFLNFYSDTELIKKLCVCTLNAQICVHLLIFDNGDG